MLPKTVINVAVTYTLVDCSNERRKLTISPSITLSNTSEPDTDIGPDFPNGMMAIRPDELNSFWNDSQITVKTSSSTHILSYLGAQPTNQTGAIFGSLVASAAKLTAVALGVPAAGAPAADAPKFCGSANDVLEKVRALQAKLINPAVSPEDIKNIPSQIATLQTALSITVQQKFDPGASPTPVNSKTGISYIGTVKPNLNQLKQSNWFNDANVALGALKNRDLQVDVFLDFGRAFPLNSVRDALHCNENRECSFSRVQVANGTLFREVAYIPVLAYQGSDNEKPVIKKTLPFGQFGTPRSLPLRAGAFQSMTWSLTFADSGEITEANFSSKASGLALASLISSASSAANSIAIEQRAAAVAADPSTIQMQNENNALKAQIDHINYTKQLHALLAAGGN